MISQLLDILSNFNELPSPIHTFGETLLFVDIEIIGDVVGWKTSLNADISEFLQDIKLLHVVIGDDWFSLLFSTEHCFGCYKVMRYL